MVNEFDSRSMDLATFKSCCDGHPIKLETKGSSVLALFKGMVFTTNVHPRDWWKEEPAIARAAVTRRIKLVQCSSLSHDAIYQHCITYFTGIDASLVSPLCSAFAPTVELPPEPMPIDVQPEPVSPASIASCDYLEQF